MMTTSLMINAMIDLALALAVGVVSAAPVTVTYYGLTAQPPLGSTQKVQVCLLDQGQQLKARLNDQLRAWHQQGGLTPQQLASLTPAFHQLEAVQACQWQASQDGLTQLPAVVINHRWVVLGERNVQDALAIYERAQRQHRLVNTGEGGA